MLVCALIYVGMGMCVCAGMYVYKCIYVNIVLNKFINFLPFSSLLLD